MVTMLSVLSLYFLGGQLIHGFATAFILGIIVVSLMPGIVEYLRARKSAAK